MPDDLFNNLLCSLRTLRLPVGQFAIFGSGPLAIQGIISNVSDLDILCRNKAWDIVKSIGVEKYLPEYDLSIVSVEDSRLTFGTHWGIGTVNVNELIDSADIIDGLPYAPLQFVIDYKRHRFSHKDREHLIALAAFERLANK